MGTFFFLLFVPIRRLLAESVEIGHALVKGLGYQEVAAHAQDRTDSNAFCGECQHFVAVGKERSPCQVIKQGTVAAGGWCRSFQKRAKPIKVKS